MTEAEVLKYLQENVRLDGDCRVWAGQYTQSGHPKIVWRRREFLARRLLLQLQDHDLNRKKVWVTCGTPGCMEPTHMKIGTQRGVMAQASKEGKLLSGIARSLSVSKMKARTTAKMPATECNKVLAMKHSGMTHREIASVYGVHPSTVGHSLNNWARLEMFSRYPLAQDVDKEELVG